MQVEVKYLEEKTVVFDCSGPKQAEAIMAGRIRKAGENGKAMVLLSVEPKRINEETSDDGPSVA